MSIFAIGDVVRATCPDEARLKVNYCGRSIAIHLPGLYRVHGIDYVQGAERFIQITAISGHIGPDITHYFWDETGFILTEEAT